MAHEANLLRLAEAEKDGVPLIDGVRVGDSRHAMCKRCYTCTRPADMGDCHTTGWLPSTDPMVWAKGLWPCMDNLCKGWCCPQLAEHYYNYRNALVVGDFPAAIEAAVAALELAGLIERVSV